MANQSLNPPLTPIIDTVTGSVTEIGRRYLRTLGALVGALAPVTARYVVTTPDPTLTAEVNLGALASGYLKLVTAVGIATPSTVATIPQADVTGLVAALAAVATLPITEANVTGLVADLAAKAPLASPTLTGVPAEPTAAVGTTTTQLATTAFVQASKANVPVTLTDGATPALDLSLVPAHLTGVFRLTAAGDRTIAIPTSPTDGQKFIIEHLASGAGRTLALNAGTGGFRFGSDITALTLTASGKIDRIGCIYNLAANKCDVVAVAKGF